MLKVSDFYLSFRGYDKAVDCRVWCFIGPVKVKVVEAGAGELVSEAKRRLRNVIEKMNLDGYGKAPEFMTNAEAGGDRPVGSDFNMPRVPSWMQDRDDI